MLPSQTLTKERQSCCSCSVLWVLLPRKINTSLGEMWDLDFPKKSPPEGHNLILIFLISENLQEIVLWHSWMENVLWIENNLPLFSPIFVLLYKYSRTKIYNIIWKHPNEILGQSNSKWHDNRKWWKEEWKVRMRLVAEVRAWRVIYYAENA